MQIKSYNNVEVKKMSENTKELKHNYKYKMFRKMMIEKAYNWRDVEKITGYTRQNIHHAFKTNYQKTIDFVFEKIQSI